MRFLQDFSILVTECPFSLNIHYADPGSFVLPEKVLENLLQCWFCYSGSAKTSPESPFESPPPFARNSCGCPSFRENKLMLSGPKLSRLQNRGPSGVKDILEVDLASSRLTVDDASRHAPDSRPPREFFALRLIEPISTLVIQVERSENLVKGCHQEGDSR